MASPPRTRAHPPARNLRRSTSSLKRWARLTGAGLIGAAAAPEPGSRTWNRWSSWTWRLVPAEPSSGLGVGVKGELRSLLTIGGGGGPSSEPRLVLLMLIVAHPGWSVVINDSKHTYIDSVSGLGMKPPSALRLASWIHAFSLLASISTSASCNFLCLVSASASASRNFGGLYSASASSRR